MSAMPRPAPPTSLCPIARSATLLGDRAVLLLLRELFFGVRRFDALQRNTGLTPQMVSARLRQLQKQGVIERRPYQDHPVRHDHWLTPAGQDLFSVLYAMRNWAERWGFPTLDAGPAAEPAIRYTHRACGRDVGLETICPGCGEELRYGSLVGQPSAALAAERLAQGGTELGKLDRQSAAR
jgi:DNA-binding HxlR family transcriptional regulator